jgi:branched-chain amino acid transport system ATP-binding protein
VNETETPPEPALVLDGVIGGYGDTTVLRGVSLTVPAGSVTALLGANGAGKTTLLKTASGLLRPKKGLVKLGGVDVTNRSPHRRTRQGLCHIPEGRAVFPGLTVRENLLLQAPGESPKAAIDRATALFPVLGTRLEQRAGTLSGGQRQMLAMVQAAVGNPKIILVDEPSLGLAPIIVDEIFEFLESLVIGGAALLLVDQFVNRVLRVADRAYVMSKGEISYEGSPEPLMEEDVFAQYVGGF